jgi:hypothetical protein
MLGWTDLKLICFNAWVQYPQQRTLTLLLHANLLSPLVLHVRHSYSSAAIVSHALFVVAPS